MNYDVIALDALTFLFSNFFYNMCKIVGNTLVPSGLCFPFSLQSRCPTKLNLVILCVKRNIKIIDYIILKYKKVVTRHADCPTSVCCDSRTFMSESLPNSIKKAFCSAHDQTCYN